MVIVSGSREGTLAWFRAQVQGFYTCETLRLDDTGSKYGGLQASPENEAGAPVPLPCPLTSEVDTCNESKGGVHQCMYQWVEENLYGINEWICMCFV